MNRPQDPSRTADPARNQLLAGIGRAHFLQNRSKVQIAEDYGLSRFQVANLLQEALERGIVRISIHLPDDEADADLAARLGIDQVVTVGAGHGAAVATRDDLARTVADAVSRIAAPGDTIGVAWSRTLQRAVQHLPAMPTCEFVQLAGAIATDDDAQGPRLLAGLEARTAWPLWAPLVVGGAAALRASPEIRGTLARADDLDVAVIAVGRWREGTSAVWDRVPPEVQKAARDAGAVAEISGRLLDAHGNPVDSPVDDMVVSATLEQISRARHTIAVAQGAERAVAALAAVRAGIVDTLVCDLGLHQALTGLLEEDAADAADRPGAAERA